MQYMSIFMTHQAAHGLEAAEKLGVHEARVFKTLWVIIDSKELAVGYSV